MSFNCLHTLYFMLRNISMYENNGTTIFDDGDKDK